MRRLLVVCAVTLAAGLVGSLALGASAAAPRGRWVIRDLGAAGRTASAAVDVNEREDVAGWVATAIPDESPSRHAILWSKGEMRDLGTLPLGGRHDMPNSSEAIAINDRGLIIGTSQVERTGPDPLAFLWSNGTDLQLGPRCERERCRGRFELRARAGG
jgi:probable HAF family extracellular repeat protein